MFTRILEALGGTFNPMRGPLTQILEAIQASGTILHPLEAKADLNALEPTATSVDRLYFVVDTNTLYVYQFQAGTDADDGDATLRPANYAASTFEFVFKKLTL